LDWSARKPNRRSLFVPPDPSRLPAYLDNWEKYYHANRPDQLVQLAIVHAQFEIIHPFSDGNGRLGRILIPLFLYEKELLHRPMFYLSSWIEENREAYVSLLRGLGKAENSWNRWIEFFLKGVDEQARKNAEKARAIMDLYERMKQKVIDITHSQVAVPLLDQIFERPLFQSSHLLFQGLNISRPSVATLLAALKEAEILRVVRQGAGRRPTVYVFPELLNICEERKNFWIASFPPLSLALLRTGRTMRALTYTVARHAGNYPRDIARDPDARYASGCLLKLILLAIVGVILLSYLTGAADSEPRAELVQPTTQSPTNQ
jgi:hypothetical protein